MTRHLLARGAGGEETSTVGALRPRPTPEVPLSPSVRPAAVPAALVALLTLPAAAVAGELQAVSSLSSTCDPSTTGTVLSGPGVDTPLVAALAAGSSAVTIDGVRVGAGEVLWAPLPARAGTERPFAVSCPETAGDTRYEIRLHPIPALPTSYVGAVGSDAVSTLPFTLTRPATVVADVVTEDGAVTVDGAPVDSATPVAVRLGTRSGTGTVTIARRDGFPIWEARLRALPATVSNLRFPSPFTNATPRAIGSVDLDEPSRLEVTVLPPTGELVVARPLAPTDLPAGTVPVAWDGRNLRGIATPDGSYRVRVRSEDATGRRTEVLAPVTLDRTGPAVTAGRVSVTLPQSVQLFAEDLQSGVAEVRVAVPASAGGSARTITAVQTAPSPTTPGTPQPRLRITVPAPDGGWRAGRHPLTVTAVDRVGSTSTRTLTVDAVEVQGGVCGRALAATAALVSSRVRDALASTREGRGRDAARVYRIAAVRCVDLDRDGTREMAVLLRSRRAGAVTPLVVFRVSPQGTYAPRVISTRHALRGIAARGRTVRGTTTRGRVVTVRAAGRDLVLRVR
ncbi:hypothetical protein C7Y72_05065 [Paraconexibacter algicola]|uniref:FlgD/Vpr Ig-like domain-containing protein n=1 Tax=Paraconexibacter algicola TaxID=2133960 RepID=A0A2T4UIJ6_9ACTN|nr:hypothetical protein C7Y72_05065 [Paraconexibacter algicola]